LAQDPCAWTLRWKESGSCSYHLSEEAAPCILPPVALVHSCTSQVRVHENQPGPGWALR